VSIFRFEWNWPMPVREPAPMPAEPLPEPLCRSCMRGQVLRGFAPGQDTVTCNLTGIPWFVPFPVCECNEYVARGQTRRVAGFADHKNGGGSARKETTR